MHMLTKMHKITSFLIYAQYPLTHDHTSNVLQQNGVIWAIIYIQAARTLVWLWQVEMKVRQHSSLMTAALI